MVGNDNALSANDALKYCNARGGVLAEPTNSLVQTALETLIATSNGTLWWIGATDAAEEGNFQWMSGTPWSYTNWKSGEPNDHLTGEDCVHMYSDGSWNDRPCQHSSSHPALGTPLCQWKGK